MATQIKLRRDSYQNWYDNNPILGQGEPGYDLTNQKLKIGDGVTLWRSLAYFDDKETNLSAVAQNILPAVDSDGTTGYTLGSPDFKWKELFVSNGSIYIGDVKLSNVGGKLRAVKVINPGEVDEEEDPEDSDAASEIGGGEGLGTITTPAVTGGTYKGLQVSYGMIHSNTDWDELNVNKIVIHKPVNPTVTIDPIGNRDDFEVSGIGSSDVLAMFVFYGDVNGAKPLSDLQAFAEAAIDNVILIDGEEGEFRTVDAMKTAFYGNYQILASAANGLYTNFQFFTYNTYFPVAGGGTLIQGSGAVFEIGDDGIGSYTAFSLQSPGSDYQPGHRILILGTSLGGATPANDCIVTVDTAVNGEILTWSVSGQAAGESSALYAPVTGTNYQVGGGFLVSTLSYNTTTDTVGVGDWSSGSGYVTGDVIKILGTDILDGNAQPLASPANDITVTLITDNGNITDFTVTGTLPRPAPIWRQSSMGDGGADQYDSGGNTINTNLAEGINYNGGNTVVNGTAAFGAGSSYSFVYDTAIFGLFVRGSSATSLGTSGNSGADSNSITEAGFIYDAPVAEQTFDNAVNHISIVAPQDPYVGAPVSFTHTNNGDEVDILIADDGNGAGVGITRDGNQGIYNPYRDEDWSSSVSPSGTLWNIDGWNTFADVETRTYLNLYAAFGNNNLGNQIVGAECVMYLPDNGKYYAVKFTQWTQNANGGGFAYTRREIDLDSVQYGIRFDDGTRLTSAEGIGRVKLRGPNSRRIEEVHGFNAVAVTERVTGNTITSTTNANNSGNTNRIRINAVGPALANLIALNNGNSYYDIQVSLDQNNWVTGYIYGTYGDYVEFAFNNQARLSVNINETVYYRTRIGGEPVRWWDKADLPGGSNNFRGAVIDYHAYTSSGTVIGTIHIVDDDGEEHITHTEVASGGGNTEFIDLWFVDTEGSICYRRTDGAGSALRIQWTAKVFYGSQTYD